MNFKSDIMFAVIAMFVTRACSTDFMPATAISYLKLEPPVSVERAGKYANGGSIYLTLVDARTNRLHMLEDHSLASRMAGRTKETLNETNTTGRIYIGLDKPTRNGRLTAVEEGVIIKAAAWCLAVDWVDRRYSLEQQRHIEIPKKTDDESIEVYLRRAEPEYAAKFIIKNFKPRE